MKNGQESGCVRQERFIAIIAGPGDMKTGYCAHLTSSSPRMLPHEESLQLCVKVINRPKVMVTLRRRDTTAWPKVMNRDLILFSVMFWGSVLAGRTEGQDVFGPKACPPRRSLSLFFSLMFFLTSWNVLQLQYLTRSFKKLIKTKSFWVVGSTLHYLLYIVPTTLYNA